MAKCVLRAERGLILDSSATWLAGPPLIPGAQHPPPNVPCPLAPKTAESGAARPRPRVPAVSAVASLVGARWRERRDGSGGNRPRLRDPSRGHSAPASRVHGPLFGGPCPPSPPRRRPSARPGVHPLLRVPTHARERAARHRGARARVRACTRRAGRWAATGRGGAAPPLLPPGRRPVCGARRWAGRKQEGRVGVEERARGGPVGL